MEDLTFVEPPVSPVTPPSLEPCLICLSKSREPADVNHRLECLEPHLRSIFVLRYLLQWSKVNCEEILRTTALSPGSWFSLCDTCVGVVRQGMEVHQEVVKLTRKLEEIQRGIESRFCQSLEEGSGGMTRNEDVGGVRSIYQLIRDSMRGSKGQDLQLPRPEQRTPTPRNIARLKRRRTGRAGDGTIERGSTEKKLKLRNNFPKAPAEFTGRDTELYKINENESDGPDPLYELPQHEEEPANMLPEEVAKDVMAKTKQREKDRARKSGRETKSNRCDKCDYTATQPYLLRMHMLNHELIDKLEFLDGDKRARCRLCGYENTKFQVLNHLRSEHASVLPPQTEFLCQYCEKTFRALKELREHVRVMHEGGRRYYCDTCGKGFMKKTRFEDHYASHSLPPGEKPYVCEECGNRFTSRQMVLVHIRTYHKGSRSKISEETGGAGGGDMSSKRKCLHCGLMVDKVGFSLHRKWVHHDLFKLKCEYCDAKFILVKDVKRHVEWKHKDILTTQLTCDRCGLRCDGRRKYQQHRKVCKQSSSGPAAKFALGSDSG